MYQINRVYSDRQITTKREDVFGKFTSIELAKEAIEETINPFLQDSIKYDVMLLQDGEIVFVNKKGRNHYSILFYITEQL